MKPTAWSYVEKYLGVHMWKEFSRCAHDETGMIHHHGETAEQIEKVSSLPQNKVGERVQIGNEAQISINKSTFNTFFV